MGEFGNQKIHTTSSPIEFKVKNIGNAPMTVTGAEPGRTPQAVDFSANADNCTKNGVGQHNGTLQPEEECTVTVTFTPSVAETEHATLEIKSNGGEATAELVGTGTAPKAVLRPASHDFDTVAFLETSSPFPFELENEGNEILNIENIEAVSASPTEAEFTVVKDAISAEECGKAGAGRQMHDRSHLQAAAQRLLHLQGGAQSRKRRRGAHLGTAWPRRIPGVRSNAVRTQLRQRACRIQKQTAPRLDQKHLDGVDDVD